ncbi:MAG: hypothetical protein WEB59_06925 [Thermoanaerobaculia bacterium]
MRRLALLILARTLAAFLAVQVADTPLFCADERPTETSASASRHAAPALSDLHAAAGSLEGDSAFCFCPCHLTFDSERSFAVVASNRTTANPSLLVPADPAAPPQSLDHPPQNLG